MSGTVYIQEIHCVKTEVFVVPSEPEKIALSYFDGPYNCAQSVIKAILEHKGLYFDEAPQVASGFGAGITYSGQQCGAVSGAILAIGALVGKIQHDVKEHKYTTYRHSSEFLDRFTQEFGSIRCDDLTGIDMSDKEALKEANESGVFMETCPKFVARTDSILLEMFPD